jgi:thymidylate synthase (FAD)
MTAHQFRSDMSVRVTRVEGEDLDIARAAWVSTKGERAEDETNTDRVTGLINMLMRDRHGSPFEQVGMQFLTSAPIFVWREHMRHRMASYNEMSGRYTRLEPVFYVPSAERPLVQHGKPGAYTFTSGSPDQYQHAARGMAAMNSAAYLTYERMLAEGVAKEVARMVLPVSIYSTAYVRMNLRALMNFLSLRTTSPDALHPSFPQREIEMVAKEYENGMREHFPLTYEAFVRNGRVAP